MGNRQYVESEKLLFERLNKLNEIKAIASTINGLNFGIYETEKGSYVYLSGAEDYDENDDNWAYQQDFYAENFACLIPFSDKTDWQQNQDLIQSLLQKYSQSADFHHTIFC